jgi:hypothetical protein
MLKLDAGRKHYVERAHTRSRQASSEQCSA